MPYPQALIQRLWNKWQQQLSLPSIQRMLKCPPKLSSEGSYFIRRLRIFLEHLHQKACLHKSLIVEVPFQNRRRQKDWNSFRLVNLLEVSWPEVLSRWDLIVTEWSSRRGVWSGEIEFESHFDCLEIYYYYEDEFFSALNVNQLL